MYTTWRDRDAKRTNIGVNNDFGGQVLCRGRAFGKQREIKLITTVFADVLISKENTRGGGAKGKYTPEFHSLRAPPRERPPRRRKDEDGK